MMRSCELRKPIPDEENNDLLKFLSTKLNGVRLYRTPLNLGINFFSNHYYLNRIPTLSCRSVVLPKNV